MFKKFFTTISFFAFLLLATSAHSGGSVGNGADIFKRQCGTCHSVRVNGDRFGKGYMNVDLTGIASEYGEEYVIMYVQDPEKARRVYSKRFDEIKENYEGKMPPVQLDESQLKELVEFLKMK